jgi:hypothetical protein
MPLFCDMVFSLPAWSVTLRLLGLRIYSKPMAKKPDSFKEEFARFLEQPSREALRNLLSTHYGELPQLEFKEQWPDTPKLVKHVLGMANSEGGCLVMGVTEKVDKTLEPSGLQALQDKTDVDKNLRRFLPQALLDVVSIMDFSYQASEYSALIGKTFQILIVPNAPENLPFLPIAETTGLRRTAIYVRRMASTEEATYEELQTILNRRIDTAHSTQNIMDLGKHLEDLKTLYGQLSRFYMANPAGTVLHELVTSFGYLSRPNPSYPKETYEAFITRMIETKKRVIQNLIGAQA